jgi:acetyl-CoA carboxylase biotin carboxylase subunit
VFRKVLIANRGEIATRIARTCSRLGVATVAVASEADRDALHVHAADEAVIIGPAAAAASYLDIDAILAAADRAGADAVHPGYGFLAENADFAAAVTDAGLTFIGPRPETIRLMGDKAAAKRHLEAAGVPVIPGVHGGGLDDDGSVVEAAKEVGLPVLLKAAAGGGGKGMRQVEDEADLAEAAAAVRREAEAAFGDGRIIVERLVARPRHIEVQVFGDGAGEVLHLFERECSIQRRHQKIVEETPSPALDAGLREQMTGAAVAAASSVDYLGAGTVEMLLSDETREFFFLEMNTRLQVEHPVTELVTGVDLVEWQLRTAAGEHLPLSQDQLRIDGHAVEVRLYAEDPAGGFLPQSGEVLDFHVPDASDLRLDAGVGAGSTVGTAYDPMLAKIIVHAPDRDAAVGRLRDVLARTSVLGLTTNLDHLQAVVGTVAFADGALTTTFLDEHLPDWDLGPAPPEAVVLTAAVLAELAGTGTGDPWAQLGPWRTAGVGGWTVRLRDRAGAEHEAEVARRGGAVTVDVGGDGARRITNLRRDSGDPAAWRCELDGGPLRLRAATVPAAARRPQDVQQVWLRVNGRTDRLDVVPATRHVAPGALVAGEAFVSPMPGTVTVVNVAEGDRVTKGTTMLVVEAMKMEHPIKAPTDGTVSALQVAEGEAVDGDQPLVALEPDASEGGA